MNKKQIGTQSKPSSLGRGKDDSDSISEWITSETWIKWTCLKILVSLVRNETGSTPQKAYWFGYLGSDWKFLGHVADNGGDTGAADIHQHLLQLEGVGAVLRLSSQDQDLLLDGNGVQVVVYLPFSINTVQVAALCLPDHRGISLSVLILATRETKAKRKVNSW